MTLREEDTADGACLVAYPGDLDPQRLRGERERAVEDAAAYSGDDFVVARARGLRPRREADALMPVRRASAVTLCGDSASVVVVR
jgi:hypothetical protein